MFVYQFRAGKYMTCRPRIADSWEYHSHIRQALAFLTNCVENGIYAYNNDIYMYANPYIREFISSIL